jgi:imidazolonepropionase-like amidohydrolase
MAVGNNHGLPYEEAVRAITLNPATILGIGEERGSLEVNKSADFILLSGDLFEIGSSMVERAFIEGVELDLTDKQKVLYEKYREKYGL